ncbi:hypothetical protein E2542_SST19769 [Spatholobus suberectus]|nr:hypothetical protein E2542_SST19769 [Spatholobus suberectus]
MASCAGKPLCNHSLINTTKHPPKRSVLLKDYLRDDLSSCSSNGFKSFPRRQCCTTVGFFVEKDLQLQRKRRNTLPRRRSNYSSSFSTISALQRASGAVINAIKSLPLSQKSAKAKKAATGLLSRSLSRKLLSRSFWRKAAREEGSEGVPRRRRSFRELILQDEEHHKATSLNEDTVFATPSMTTSSGCGSDSWGDSEFTFASTVASSESSNENHLVPEGTKDGAPQHKPDEVATKEYWPNEKEQFSPVSILDCPFEDEEEIYKSHFTSTSTVLSFLEGAKQKHMQKRRYFESVAPLEPVVLENRFARLELGDEPHDHSPKQCSPVLVPIKRTQNGNSNLRRDNNHNIEENIACDLLNFVKRSIPSNSLIIKAENLLFDYFKQSMGESKDIDHSKKLHLSKVAEDWIHGQPQEQYLGWEVQGGRCVYIREMDKCGEWKNSDQEIQQLALELANEVFANLVNELVLDLTTRASH